MEREHLSIVFVGNADAGKTTMFGNLLQSATPIVPLLPHPALHLPYISKDERANGYTSDVYIWKYTSEKYLVTLVDTPGRSRYLKNMLAGISQADAAIFVISAAEGEFEAAKSGGSLKEHAVIFMALGIKQIIVTVNKMDDLSVQWNRNRCEVITSYCSSELQQAGLKSDKVRFLPLSGLTGDNVAQASPNLAWFTGLSLRDAIDALEPPLRMRDKPFRMAILRAYKVPGVGTLVTGRVLSGVLQNRTPVCMAYPRGAAEVTSIEMHHQPLAEASAGDIIAFHVRPFSLRELPRGNIAGSYKTASPQVVDQFIGKVIILNHPGKIKPGYSPLLSCHTAQFACTIQNIANKIDKKTGEVKEQNPQELKNGDCALVSMVPCKPICLEPFAEFPALGRFVLCDLQRIIGVGIVVSVQHMQLDRGKKVQTTNNK